VPGTSSDDGQPGGAGDAGRGRRPWSSLGPDQQRRLESLYGQYGRLIALATRSLPTDERDSAEDLVQAVFLEATARCCASPHFLPGKGWLLRRLRSRIVDRYRRRGRERKHGFYRSPAADPWTAQVVSAERAVSAEEEAVANIRVEELLATIPDPKDRAAIRLKIEGLQEADIARLLGVHYPTRQVRDRLARARRQVKEAARRDGGPDRRMGGPAA
jgi:RNA polymerase sigma factor (sigma-70 family)